MVYVQYVHPATNPWKSPNAILVQTYSPPSSGNRVESSTTTNAVGTKNSSAANTHKLIEDCPLRAAAAIHRGPSTVAIQNSSTSQNPITRRNCCFASAATVVCPLTTSRPRGGGVHPGGRNSGGTVQARLRTRPIRQNRPRAPHEEKQSGRRVFSPS